MKSREPMAVLGYVSAKPVRVFLVFSSILCLFVFWSAILSSMWTFESELVKEEGYSGDQVCHVLVISTYPPRRCGIGVFADNFIKSMRSMGPEFSQRIDANRRCEYSVIAFDDPDSTNAYNASTVLGIINLDADVPSRAFWNASMYVVGHQKRTVKNLKDPKVLSFSKKDLPFTHMVLQLEFGLIKIKWQALDLVRWMTGTLDAIEGMPHLHTTIVVHSPYAYPNLEEKGFVRHISYFADAFVVMSWHAYHSMVSAYGVDKSKVYFIPHAVRKPRELTEVPRNVDAAQLADARQGGLSLDQLDNLLALPKDDPRRPLLIFNNGLIHVHKGYNRVIRNLQRIIDAVPEKPIVVLITGREARTNEEKDIMKKHLEYAAELGVAQHIIWQDEYVESEEVDRRLYGSDVYMTPYDEITPTSGALLEAMAHGCAILSTAYRHATEVLSSERGMLVPFEDDDAITAGFVKLLTSQEVREAYGVRAKAFVKNWSWERVALQYHALLAKLESNAIANGGSNQLQTPGVAYVEELLLPVTPDPFFLNPAFDAHLYPPRDRDDSELQTITPENNHVNSFRPASAHWSESLITTFNGVTLFSNDKLKSYEGEVLPKELRLNPGIYVLFADKDLQVNGKVGRSETGYLLSRVGIRWGLTWILADITMGLDLETFNPDVDNPMDLSEFLHIDRLEPEPGKEGAGWRERLVLRARQVWVTLVVHMNKEVSVTLSQPDRFSHPLGLLGQTIRCHWDLPAILQECADMFKDDVKSLHPEQWKMSLLEGSNIFSTASKGQTWQMFGIRLNAFAIDEEKMTGVLFDYYDTSLPSTVLKFRLEGPVLDNCGFAMVNRQLWFGLSMRQQLRHNWLSVAPNPFNKDFEIEVEVIPTEDTVSVEQYEKAASPGSVLHMLVYTAYKKQLQLPPDQVNSPVVSVFRNHWPPKFQYPNESLPAEVAAGTKIMWIHQQPWEFYGIPKSWTTWLINAVDALWVPSRHCEVGYIANQIPARKINVVRHGVSYQKFQTVNPGMASGGSLALPEMAKPLQSKTFKFLFIGGALPRKGIDLLLRAFVETFSTHDDVSLIVHSIYGDEFKTHVMEALQTQYDKYPEIVFLKQELTWVDMVLLYRSVNIYICPYRNEGFGLTIVEAMSNGLPVIITRGGPAMEICEDDHTFWVDAEWTRCRDIKPCEANGTKIFGEELAVPAAWFEPDLGSLSAAMRNAYRMSTPQLHKMGLAAKKRAAELTWEPVYMEMEKVLARFTLEKQSVT